MFRSLVVVACLLVAHTGWAQEAPPERLRDAVALAVAESWGVAPDLLQLDWTRLPEQPLPADAPFRIVGRGSDGWLAIVVDRPNDAPYAVRVHAGVRTPVHVASRALTVGHVILEEDIRRVERVRWGMPGDMANTPPVGAVVRRGVAAGEELRVPTIKQPELVASGDRVSVTFQNGGVTVTAPGTAVSRGALGQTIAIRLDGGRRRVRGVVTGAGAVRISK